MTGRTPVVLVAVLAASLAPGCRKDPNVAKRDYVRSGDEYVQQKKYREAIVQYLNAERIDPKFAEARTKLARAYIASGDVVNGYREYVRAADLLPKDVSAQLTAGEVLLAAGRYDEAKSRADLALVTDPKSVDAMLLRAHALARMRKLDDSITQIEQAIKDDPTHASTYSSLGGVELAGGNRQAAEAAFKTAVSRDPASLQARLALAYFYWVAGRRQEAELQLRAAHDLDPKNLLTNRALAAFYVASGEAPKAEAYLKAVAADSPGSQGKLALADYYLASHRTPEAHRILDDLAKDEKNPEGSTGAQIRLAALGYNTSSPAPALKLIDDVLAKHPTDVNALLAKAEMLAGVGKFDEARKEADAAIAAGPQNASARFTLGRIDVLRHDEAGAATAFQDALRLDPRMATADVQLAKLDLSASRLDDAEQHALTAAESVPGYIEAQVLLGRIYLLKGNMARAEPTIRALARALPDLPVAQGELGQVELLTNNRTAARAAFEHALAKDPAQLDALAGLVAMDVQDKQGSVAKSRLEAAVRRAPQNSELLVLAARTYDLVGDRAGAENMAHAAIQADPNNYDAYQALGTLYVSEHRVADGIAEFSELATKKPNSAGTQTVLGVLFEIQKNPSAARARYEHALALDPRAAVAANNLAWMMVSEGGDLDVALNLAQTAKSRLPDQPEVNDTLGWIYYKKGLASMAIGPLEQSVAKDPENRGYQAHLGEAYAKAGNSAKARDMLQKALAHGDDFADAKDARATLATLSGR